MSEHVTIAHVGMSDDFDILSNDIKRVKDSVFILGDVILKKYNGVMTETFDTPRSLSEIHAALKEAFSDPSSYTVVYNKHAGSNCGDDTAQFAIINNTPSQKHISTPRPFPWS